jgi:membrane protein DedA with SNARE-associated domain
MSEAIHLFVERYGLVAVFLGCVAEGESAAILAGFFAHQAVFNVWQAYTAALAGAFAGDTLFFVAGRRFGDLGWVARLRHKPGFDRAFRLVTEHPVAFVLLNRYAYGFRLVGGVAAGLSGMAPPKFVALNFASAAIWAGVFCLLGYVFGLGAETIVGAALARHERLLVGLVIGLAAAVLSWLVARRLNRRVAFVK